EVLAVAPGGPQALEGGAVLDPERGGVGVEVLDRDRLGPGRRPLGEVLGDRRGPVAEAAGGVAGPLGAGLLVPLRARVDRQLAAAALVGLADADPDLDRAVL